MKARKRTVDSQTPRMTLATVMMYLLAKRHKRKMGKLLLKVIVNLFKKANGTTLHLGERAQPKKRLMTAKTRSTLTTNQARMMTKSIA